METRTRTRTRTRVCVNAALLAFVAIQLIISEPTYALPSSNSLL